MKQSVLSDVRVKNTSKTEFISPRHNSDLRNSKARPISTTNHFSITKAVPGENSMLILISLSGIMRWYVDMSPQRFAFSQSLLLLAMRAEKRLFGCFRKSSLQNKRFFAPLSVNTFVSNIYMWRQAFEMKLLASSDSASHLPPKHNITNKD